jgi:hypothetical protein
MARHAKTVSITQLQAAVKTALEAAKKEHPQLKLDAVTISGSSDPLPIYYRFPWICGIPPFPWPEGELQNLVALNTKFVANLAANSSIAAVAAEGGFKPTIQLSGGTASIGFAPADVSLIP